ncbi:MAG: hypothetical protein HC850_07885 [Rhodomicrobium sp.]|nr:hypothetical protein [Rhodomicrobium sp.]
MDAEDVIERQFEALTPTADETPADVPIATNVDAWTAPDPDPDPDLLATSEDVWATPTDSAEASLDAEDPFAAPLTSMTQSDDSSVTDESSFSGEPAGVDSPEMTGTPDTATAAMY